MSDEAILAGSPEMSEVVVYTRQFCGFCSAAKALLDEIGVAYVERDATGKPEVRAEMIRRANGGATFPQIFIGDRHVGGCDDLYELQSAGRLAELLSGGEVAPA
jgi:glutaredoxin 3